jgi:hypothetical protein
MKKYKINPELIVEHIDKTITFFDAEKSLLYTLNEMGSFIFTLLKKGELEENIAKKIFNTFDVSEQKAKQDTKLIVNKLIKNQIISLID